MQNMSIPVVIDDGDIQNVDYFKCTTKWDEHGVSLGHSVSLGRIVEIIRMSTDNIKRYNEYVNKEWGEVTLDEADTWFKFTELCDEYFRSYMNKAAFALYINELQKLHDLN